MRVALYFAAPADKQIKGARAYRALLIWPYAVAPAVAGVLWLFMVNTRAGVVTWYLGQLGDDWNHVLNEGEAMGLVVAASARCRISHNFLFFLAGCMRFLRDVRGVDPDDHSVQVHRTQGTLPMAEPIRIVEGDLNGHAGNAIYAEPLGAETLIQLRTTDGQSVTVRHDGGRAVPAEKQAIVIAWDRNDQVLFACDRQRMQSGT